MSSEELRLWGILASIGAALVTTILIGVRMLLSGRLIPVREHERVIAVYETRNAELVARNAEWQRLYFAQVQLNGELNGQFSEVLDGIRKAREAGAA